MLWEGAGRSSWWCYHIVWPRLPARGPACWWCGALAEAAPLPSPRWSLSQCVCFLRLCPHDARPHLLLFSLTSCESAAAAKLRQQISNAKIFQRSLPTFLFGKLLSITLCTENKHERKNSPLPSVVRAKTRIPWALFRSANILPQAFIISHTDLQSSADGEGTALKSWAALFIYLLKIKTKKFPAPVKSRLESGIKREALVPAAIEQAVFGWCDGGPLTQLGGNTANVARSSLSRLALAELKATELYFCRFSFPCSQQDLKLLSALTKQNSVLPAPCPGCPMHKFPCCSSCQPFRFCQWRVCFQAQEYRLFEIWNWFWF